MPKLMLVRHGETVWNAEQRLQGHSDPPLSEVGLQQAKRLASRLADAQLAAIYSSDLSRARETADIIAAGRGIDVHATSDLRERDCGRWEGQTYAQIRATDPVEFSNWRSGIAEYQPPEGESFGAILRRVSRFTSGLEQAHPGDVNVLVVSHGGALMTLALHVLELPASAHRNLVLANTSLSIIDLRSGHPVLDLWNDVSHAEGKL